MKLNRLKTILIVLALLTLVSSAVIADDFQLPKPNKYFYVYDEVGVIGKNTANYIIQVNEQLYDKTGSQIVVAVVNSLQNRTEQEFAVALFREWGVGNKDKNNGVLILVAPNEKRLWIEVGYGLEGALPDGKVGEIRDKEIFPYFKDGDFENGILNGFNSILSVIANEYDIDYNTNGAPNYEDSRTDKKDIGIFRNIKNILIVIGIVLFLILDQIFFRGFFTMMLLRIAMRGGFRGGGGNDRGNSGGGGSSGGGGAGGGW